MEFWVYTKIIVQNSTELIISFLVSRYFIATAAHCIQQARIKDIIVYLGELDTQNSGLTMEPLPAEKHRVIKKIVHPRFQFRVTQPDRYDLALLQLAQPAVYK